MAILDTAKDIYDLAKKGLTIELQEKIMSLREEALELQEENLQLRQRLMEFEEMARTKSAVTFDAQSGFYYKDGQGPFCQVCYDADQKLCRVVSLTNTSPGYPFSKRCNVCRKSYK